MEPLILHFSPTGADYVAAAKDLQRKFGRTWRSSVLPSLVAIAVLAVFNVQRGQFYDEWAWLPVLLLVPVFVYNQFVSHGRRGSSIRTTHTCAGR